MLKMPRISSMVAVQVKLASIIINSPAILLLFLFATSLMGNIISYNHLQAGDTRYLVHRICEVHTNGHLTTSATPDSTGKAVACICDPLEGCISLTTVEQRYTWLFGTDLLYGVNGGIFLWFYQRQRKYLQSFGIFEKRPKTISAASIMVLCVSILSLFGPFIGAGWLTQAAHQFGLDSLVTLFNLRMTNVMIAFATLPVGTSIMVAGQQKGMWVRKASIGVVLFAIAVLNPFIIEPYSDI
jgi:hypothetical protein